MTTIDLFLKLKEHLRETHFSDGENVMAEVNDWLESQNKEFFPGVSTYKHHYSECIIVLGDYGEK